MLPADEVEVWIFVVVAEDVVDVGTVVVIVPSDTIIVVAVTGVVDVGAVVEPVVTDVVPVA